MNYKISPASSEKNLAGESVISSWLQNKYLICFGYTSHFNFHNIVSSFNLVPVNEEWYNVYTCVKMYIALQGLFIYTLEVIQFNITVRCMTCKYPCQQRAGCRIGI